jgi:hypothetical protein
MSRISDANRRVACCREAADAALRRVKARGDALQDVLGAHPVLLIGGGVIAGALAGRVVNRPSRAGAPATSLFRRLAKLSSWGSTALALFSRAQAMLAAAQSTTAEAVADAAEDQAT